MVHQPRLLWVLKRRAEKPYPTDATILSPAAGQPGSFFEQYT